MSGTSLGSRRLSLLAGRCLLLSAVLALPDSAGLRALEAPECLWADAVEDVRCGVSAGLVAADLSLWGFVA